VDGFLQQTTANPIPGRRGPPVEPGSGPTTNRRAVMRLHRAGDAGRADAEQFVQSIYAACYGARVPSFAPVLVTLEADGKTVAAAGYRRALAPLYLERYLGVPVERAIAATGRPVPSRGRIVEVGHLASARPGEGRRLMALLAAHLAESGAEWVVSTATEGLRGMLARIGMVVLELGEARGDILGPEHASWGSYYEHRPSVLAGELLANLPRLHRRSAA
jgi:hypothetical protein